MISDLYFVLDFLGNPMRFSCNLLFLFTFFTVSPLSSPLSYLYNDNEIYSIVFRLCYSDISSYGIGTLFDRSQIRFLTNSHIMMHQVPIPVLPFLPIINLDS